MSLFKRRRGIEGKQTHLKGRVVKSRSAKEGAKPYVVQSRYWFGEFRDGQGRVVRKKLAPDRLGLGNRFANQEKRPLAEHLAEYVADLGARGNCSEYVLTTESHAKKVLQGCKWVYARDITPEAAQAYLADLGKRGLGPSAVNHYLKAVKGFAAWMMRNRRTSENRLAYLRGFNPKLDVRHERRALTDEECRRLVQAAERGPVRFGMSGPQRALVYRLALGTGLRRNELRSLTWSSFDLDGREPTVTVEAGYSKHRRRDVLPLASHLVPALRDWKAEHPADGVVFPLSQDTARMLKVDLKDAGVDPDKGDRVVDFHALRHTFITKLAEGKVHPKVAQMLARHQSITLTMDHYTHLDVLSHRPALDALPDLGQNAQGEQARKKGVG
jgi:integrase